MGANLKRFYDEADVEAVEDGFRVVLDARPVRTPMGAPLTVVHEGLACAMADEWDAQETEVVFPAMPVTRIVGTGIDLVPKDVGGYVAQALAYAETDLLCYRASEPHDLVARQHDVWDPLLKWAEDRFGVVLKVTEGVLPVTQPPETMGPLKASIASYGAIRLSALNSAVAACGSLIVGLALAEGRVSAEEAFEIAELESGYQIDRWGEDIEATKRRTRLRADISAAAAVLEATREV